jgi:hypothetical protein
MNRDDVFGGFAWAVPRAFGAAVHACRFEQGDVLYSEISGYAEPKAGKPPAPHHIQVLDPPRTTRALSGDGEGQRFFSNWASRVEFEWMDYGQKQSTTLEGCQGGLFTCLWKGDLGALEADLLSEPARPFLLRDLQARLADSVGPIVERFEKARPGRSNRRKTFAGRRLFVGAIDQSSDASRVKWHSILRALDAQFEIERRQFSPGDLELPEAERFHPALELFGVAVECRDDAKIESVLREVLYAGGKVAGQENGRFQLARHGALVALS